MQFSASCPTVARTSYSRAARKTDLQVAGTMSRYADFQLPPGRPHAGNVSFFHSLIAPRRYSVAMKITPLLYMDAIEPSLEFWAGKLGFEKTAEAPEGGFVILQKDGAELMLQTRESLAKDIPQMLDYARSSSGLLFIEVDDFNAMLKHVEGLKVVLPERTAVYGMREIIVLEPGGNPVCFATPVAK